MKDYSFKLYDTRFVEAIDRWVEEGYTIRGMVEELLAKYEGLQAPKPDEIREINIEMRDMRKDIEILKKNNEDLVKILMENINDLEAIKAYMGILPLASQHHPMTTNSPIEEESRAHRSNHRERPLGNPEAQT